jgi:uncharacterized protein
MPDEVVQGAAAAAERPQGYAPGSWKVTFVQDCNLECRYCCTGFGRFGRERQYMNEEIWTRLAELIAAMAPNGKRVDVEFGGGETFLRFGASILTNGTVATRDQLRECLERRIALSFSIDGPQVDHDAFRVFRDGRSTHHIALENWRYYRELADGVPDPPGCVVSTVVAGNSRLAAVAEFWCRQGVTRYKAIPAEPSRFLAGQELEEWNVRRARYLEDFKVLAFSEAERLRGRTLEKEFEGPLSILDPWRRLKGSAPYSMCGAGHNVIAVDALGDLFPCQGFVGFQQRSIGDVYSGVRNEELQEFRAARLAVQRSCNGCWARFLCDGGCCAGDPENGVVLDSWNGCQFTRAHVEITLASYLHWRNHGPSQPGIPK